MVHRAKRASACECVYVRGYNCKICDMPYKNWVNLFIRSLGAIWGKAHKYTPKSWQVFSSNWKETTTNPFLMRPEWKEMDENKLNSNQSGKKIGNDFSILGRTNKATSIGTTKRYDTGEWMVNSRRICCRRRGFSSVHFHNLSLPWHYLTWCRVGQTLEQCERFTQTKKKSVFKLFRMDEFNTQWITKQVGHWDATQDRVEKEEEEEKMRVDILLSKWIK